MGKLLVVSIYTFRICLTHARHILPREGIEEPRRKRRDAFPRETQGRGCSCRRAGRMPTIWYKPGGTVNSVVGS